jgi:hypothetical protein
LIEETEEGFAFDLEAEKAYTDLMEGIDPDNFLCFDDDGFINSVHNYENNTLGLDGQEAEEGEIPA